MIRRVIQIDEEKCNGCGACAKACHEGAIGMVNGKAKLMRDDYCDGLGDCLPACPTNAISFVEREAAAYDEKAVEENKKRLGKPVFHGCPGSMMKTFAKKPAPVDTPSAKTPSQLMQWPVQIKLVPVNAPYFDGADLLVAADCTAYACGSFHSDFMTGKITVIGCPKLDATDYSEKLGEIVKRNNIRSITVARMEVPCCGGIEHAVRKAVTDSGKNIPVAVRIITTDGNVIFHICRGDLWPPAFFLCLIYLTERNLFTLSHDLSQLAQSLFRSLIKRRAYSHNRLSNGNILEVFHIALHDPGRSRRP